MTKSINEYKHSFFLRTISQWNCLLKALVDSETVDAFRHGLKDLTLHRSGIGHISIYTPIEVSADYLFRFSFRHNQVNQV